MDPISLIKRGDTIKVSQKITEGKRERIVLFRGKVIKVRGSGSNKMLTVRQTLEGVDVDRIFPVVAPTIAKIEVVEEKKAKPQRKTRTKKAA